MSKRSQLLPELSEFSFNSQEPSKKKRKLNSKNDGDNAVVAPKVTDIDAKNFKFGVWNQFKSIWNSWYSNPCNKIGTDTPFEEFCYKIFALGHLTLLDLLHSRFARRKDWSMPPWLAKQVLLQHCLHVRYVFIYIASFYVIFVGFICCFCCFSRHVIKLGVTKCNVPFDPNITEYMNDYVLKIIPLIENHNNLFAGKNGVDHNDEHINLDCKFYQSLDKACQGHALNIMYSWSKKECLKSNIFTKTDIGNIILKYCSLDFFLLPSEIAVVCKLVQHLSGVIGQLFCVSSKLSNGDDLFNNLICWLCSGCQQTGNKSEHKQQREVMPVLQSSFYNLFVGFDGVVDLISTQCSKPNLAVSNKIFGHECNKDLNLLNRINDLLRISTCLRSIIPANSSFESYIKVISHIAGLTTTGKANMSNDIDSKATFDAKYLTQVNSPLAKYGVKLDDLIPFITAEVDLIWGDVPNEDLKNRLRTQLTQIMQQYSLDVKFQQLFGLLNAEAFFISDKCIQCNILIQSLKDDDAKADVFIELQKWYYCTRFILFNGVGKFDYETACFVLIEILQILHNKISSNIAANCFSGTILSGMQFIGGSDIIQVVVSAITYSIGLFIVICKIVFVNQPLNVHWDKVKSNTAISKKLKELLAGIYVKVESHVQNVTLLKKLPIDCVVKAVQKLYGVCSQDISADSCILNKLINLFHYLFVKNGCNVSADIDNSLFVDRVDVAISLSRLHLSGGNDIDNNQMNSSLRQFSDNWLNTSNKASKIETRKNISDSKTKSVPNYNNDKYASPPIYTLNFPRRSTRIRNTKNRKKNNQTKQTSTKNTKNNKSKNSNKKSSKNTTRKRKTKSKSISTKKNKSNSKTNNKNQRHKHKSKDDSDEDSDSNDDDLNDDSVSNDDDLHSNDNSNSVLNLHLSDDEDGVDKDCGTDNDPGKDDDDHDEHDSPDININTRVSNVRNIMSQSSETLISDAASTVDSFEKIIDDKSNVIVGKELNSKQLFRKMICQYIRWNDLFGYSIHHCQQEFFGKHVILFNDYKYKCKINRIRSHLQLIGNSIINDIAKTHWNSNINDLNININMNNLDGLNQEARNPAGKFMANNNNMNKNNDNNNNSNGKKNGSGVEDVGNEDNVIDKLHKIEGRFDKLQDPMGKLKCMVQWIQLIFAQMVLDQFKIADEIPQLQNISNQYYTYALLMQKLGLMSESGLNDIACQFEWIKQIVLLIFICLFVCWF